MWSVWSSFVFSEKKPSSLVTASTPLLPLTTAPIIGSPVSWLITRALYVVCAFKLTAEAIDSMTILLLMFSIINVLYCYPL